MNLEIRKKAMKFIERQDKSTQMRLFNAIYAIPYGDIKRLNGYDGLYRLRIGDYRVLYTIEKSRQVIIIMNVGNRGDVYDNL